MIIFNMAPTGNQQWSGATLGHPGMRRLSGAVSRPGTMFQFGGLGLRP